MYNGGNNSNWNLTKNTVDFEDHEILTRLILVVSKYYSG